MRTNIEIDDELVRQALASTGSRIKQGCGGAGAQASHTDAQPGWHPRLERQSAMGRDWAAMRKSRFSRD